MAFKLVRAQCALGSSAQCIRIGVMKDNFVFDHILHILDLVAGALVWSPSRLLAQSPFLSAI